VIVDYTARQQTGADTNPNKSLDYQTLLNQSLLAKEQNRNTAKHPSVKSQRSSLLLFMPLWGQLCV